MRQKVQRSLIRLMFTLEKVRITQISTLDYLSDQSKGKFRGSAVKVFAEVINAIEALKAQAKDETHKVLLLA